jgi:hypothetical protein
MLNELGSTVAQIKTGQVWTRIWAVPYGQAGSAQPNEVTKTVQW